MIHKQFLEIVLVLLASSTVFSPELKEGLLQPRMNRERLQLLNNLQTLSIQQCLPHRKNFLLPWKSVTPHRYQKEHALAILHEMVQQIFNLFKANSSLGHLKDNHIEKFLIELHQQLAYLEALMRLYPEQKSGALGSENLRLQVKAYFRRIHDYLENQGYSICARIIVQVEITQCLLFVFRFTGRLSNEERDP
ncbi:interferon epsilon [Castor canadensis]|uniref:Interferon epsilon n=1 Tax=Castor canadensis TaxID=51338 RepID=A0A8B7TS53_CASCN